MSNNRMYLCKGDKKILLAKYFPTTNWYIFYSREKLNDWFEEVEDWVSMYGPTDFRLEFETTEEGDK